MNEVLKRLKSINNPYKWNHKNIPENYFVGRSAEMGVYNNVINQSDFSNNLLIEGPRTVGKSTLLRFIKERFNNDYAVCEIELSKTKKYSEMEFFQIMIQNLYDSYYDAVKDELKEENKLDNFLHEDHKNIWEELTIYSTVASEESGQNQSANRGLPIFNLYEKGNTYPVFDEKIIIYTIKQIIEDLLNAELGLGFVLLIDEYQEFVKYPRILELLTRASAEISEFLIICCGLNNELLLPEDKNSIIKFIQSCGTNAISLKGLDETFLEDFIYIPIEKNAQLERDDITEFIDTDLFTQLAENTDGNPYHLQLILKTAYEHFKNQPNLEKLTFNDEVIKMIMETYQRESKEAVNVVNSLDSMDTDELEVFILLLYSQNINLRNIVMLRNAFNNLNNEALDELHTSLIKEIASITAYDLLIFKDANGDIVDPEFLQNVDRKNAHKYKYVFIGDNIDKIFTAYNLKARLSLPKDINLWKTHNYESILAQQVSSEFARSLAEKELDIIDEDSEDLPKNWALSQTLKASEVDFDTDMDKYTDNVSELNQHLSSDIEKPKIIEKLTEFSNKYNLSYPIQRASWMNINHYYIISFKVKVRQQEYYNRYLVPIHQDRKSNKILNKKIDDYKKYTAASYHEYEIDIREISINILPKLIIFISQETFGNASSSKIFQNMRNHNFEEAIIFADLACRYNRLIDVDSLIPFNNLAFCLICNNQHEQAQNLLKPIEDKIATARINLLFVKSLIDDKSKTAKAYNKFLKKLNPETDTYDFAYIHLCINHERIDNEHKIIRACTSYNLVSWNLLLLSIQSIELGTPSSMQIFQKYEGFVNKGKKTKQEEFINIRVWYWYKYYRSIKENNLAAKIENIIDEANKLLDDIKKYEFDIETDNALFINEEYYLIFQIENDIEIFMDEI